MKPVISFVFHFSHWVPK